MSFHESVSTVVVRFAETDKSGYAYHGAYFAWFEVGRTGLLRERGRTYGELMALDVHLPVVQANVKFLRPIAYDDVVEIKTRLALVTGVRVLFEYELRRQNDPKLLTQASTEHAAVSASGRPKRFPEDILRILR